MSTMDDAYMGEARGLPAFRTPPCNFECEKALLGGLMAYNHVAPQVSGFLDPEHFADPVHTRIYEAILACLERPGGVADPVTLRRLFESDGTLQDVGGIKYLAELAASMVSEINILEYARLTRELHVKRLLLGLGERIVDGAHSDTDARDLIATLESELYAISPRKESGDPETIAAAADIGLAELDEAMKRHLENRDVGVMTGLHDLDRVMGPMLPGDFVVIAGGTSMGKTAIGQQIVKRAAQRGVRCLHVTLEMRKEQLAMRAIAARAGVAIQAIRSGRVSNADLARIMDARVEISALPIVLYDRPGAALPQIRGIARRMQRGRGLGLILVDYIQLVEAAERSGSRVEDVTEITRGLKRLAGELMVPVIGLSQISRAVDSRDDHRPRISDLRESGSIEQDADFVVLAYRDEYYRMRENVSESDDNQDGETTKEYEARQKRLKRYPARTAELIVGKNRHGPAETVRAGWDGRGMTFFNLGGDA